ncbi:replication initiation and membrane attachment family protein [Mycoplasmopsis iners]|uniref:hypothetical protein n=1 Tax=Mycoplasmopsis iners TaxID=76630 RepID=UPI0004950CF7|nr:hypothetical protein [Mycoplasmopsis iners]
MHKSLKYSSFKIQFETSISGEDLRNLRKFYTPIIGADAIALYEYLRDLSLVESKITGYKNFDNLAVLLNISATKLNAARNKLESLSLLSTYQDDFRKVTLFQLEKPLNNKSFNRNPILSTKLKEIIGKENYNALINEHKVNELIKVEDLQEISATYDDIFDFEVETEDDQHEKIINDLFSTPSSLLLENTYEFDNLYEAILKSQPIKYYEQLLKCDAEDDVFELVDYAQELGFENQIINLVFWYSYEMNSKVVIPHVQTILEDFKSQGINDFESIENYLDSLIKNKKGNIVTKKTLWKASYMTGLTKEEGLLSQY